MIYDFRLKAEYFNSRKIRVELSDFIWFNLKTNYIILAQQRRARKWYRIENPN